MRLLGSTLEKESLGSGGRRAIRRSRTTDRNRSRSCASRTGDYVCQSVAVVGREGDIVDRVAMELEVRNTGFERLPFHQSVLPLEERNLDSRNHRRSVWLHGIEQSPSREDSSLLNVMHQLRAALARPWPVTGYVEGGRSRERFNGQMRCNCRRQGRDRADPSAACAC